MKDVVRTVDQDVGHPGSFRSGSSGPAPTLCRRNDSTVSSTAEPLTTRPSAGMAVATSTGEYCRPRPPLDRVEVGPPVRGGGRLVDRGIKVQALGRGARVQSLAETAQSPRTDSRTGGRRNGSRHPATSRVVLLVNGGHRMCCRRYGHDHRSAMITKAHRPVILAHRLGTFLNILGTPERAGFSRPLAGRSKIICS
jgi:hypothetical protein